MTKKFLNIFFFVVTAIIFCGESSALKIPSKEFLLRGGKHCTGYCEAGKINCRKGVSQQGHYDWCQINCLHKKKIDREKFILGIKHCDEITTPKTGQDYVGKVVQCGEGARGCLVRILGKSKARLPHNPGEWVYLHPDKREKGGIKLGDIVDFSDVPRKSVPAGEYGRFPAITVAPVKRQGIKYPVIF